MKWWREWRMWDTTCIVFRNKNVRFGKDSSFPSKCNNSSLFQTHHIRQVGAVLRTPNVPFQDSTRAITELGITQVSPVGYILRMNKLYSKKTKINLKIISPHYKKKLLFTRVKTLEISIKNLRKRLFRLSRWLSKGVDRNTVKKDVSTAYTKVEESILSLSTVITLDKNGYNPR